MLSKLIKENELITTNDIHQALWLFPRNIMLDGEYDGPYRGQDHRIIESLTPYDRYDGDKFWDYAHHELRGVRLVPETGIALIKQGQKLTSTQKKHLADTGFQIEKY